MGQETNKTKKSSFAVRFSFSFFYCSLQVLISYPGGFNETEGEHKLPKKEVFQKLVHRNDESLPKGNDLGDTRPAYRSIEPWLMRGPNEQLNCTELF
jgi:hypothetical protein